jgi:hypothetical protein
VCANQHFVPHLIDRSGISMFRCDTLADESLQIAQYVLLDPKVGGRGAWPCSIADYEAAVGRLRRNPEFAITREADGILLFERVVRAPQATSAAAPPG